MVWFLAFFTLGFNFTFWVVVGFLRLIFEKLGSSKRNREKRLEPLPINFSEVAAIVPAHNEEDSIRKTIAALLQVLPAKNIYVVSDYSTDRTIKIIRAMGVRSLDLRPNKGKAKALVYIMHEYGLLKAYKAILINDADCIIDPNYLHLALQYFRDENVAAVSPHGQTRWGRTKLSELFLISYRAKLWKVMQWGLRFGQTWKVANASYIIPGAFSIYRTRVLEHLEIDAPGLVIEDFNMTFEVQKKKLGKIIYAPEIKATHQDPYILEDYIKQLRRWNVGYWQTIFRHGIWPSFLWLTMGAFLIELTFYSIFFLTIPLIVTLLILNSFDPVTIPIIGRTFRLIDILIGVFLIDYIMTVLVAITERKPIMLFLGLGFVFLRFIDTIVFFISIPEAIFKKYDGTWTSPKRG